MRNSPISSQQISAFSHLSAIQDGFDQVKKRVVPELQLSSSEQAALFEIIENVSLNISYVYHPSGDWGNMYVDRVFIYDSSDRRSLKGHQDGHIEKRTYRQTHIQTDKQTNRHTDGQTYREKQTDRQTDIQIDRVADRYADRHASMAQ